MRFLFLSLTVFSFYTLYQYTLQYTLLLYYIIFLNAQKRMIIFIASKFRSSVADAFVWKVSRHKFAVLYGIEY